MEESVAGWEQGDTIVTKKHTRMEAMVDDAAKSFRFSFTSRT